MVMGSWVTFFLAYSLYISCNSYSFHHVSTRIVLKISKQSAMSAPFGGACESLQYTLGREIGDPGGSGTGRVYSATISSPDSLQRQPSSLNAVVKKSWGHKIYLTFPPSTPAQAVSKECDMLRRLEKYGVSNIPRCVASCYDSRADQTTIIMQPLFIGATSADTNPDKASIKTIKSLDARIAATRKLAVTTVQLLGRARVVTTGLSDHQPSSLFSSQPINAVKSASSDYESLKDESFEGPEIQFLVNSDTGDILVIDFTESEELTLGPNGLFSDKSLQLADAFVHSAASLVPEDCVTEWREVIQSSVVGDDRIQSQLKNILLKYASI